MWDRKELKAKGKAAFQANYWKCVIVALILTAIIGGGAGSAKNSVDGANGTNGGTIVQSGSIDTLPSPPFETEQSIDNPPIDLFSTVPEEDRGTAVKIVVGVLSGVAAIGFFVKLLAINPLTVGCTRFFIVNSDAPADLSELLYGFKNGYGNVVVGMFMRDLFTFLWSLLFIVPGIIKSYSYRMVPNLLADEPGISGPEAMERSKQMMHGHKWKTFLLDLSFIGWFLLSVITLGIVNVFWTQPYLEATDAELYKTLKNA